MLSVVMSTFNKAKYLDKTLDSIASQDFRGEVIVVDDGSTDGTESVCRKRGVTYIKIEREPIYRNPCFARNIGYKAASGDIVICQSDDVIHERKDTIKKLSELKSGEFHLATVHNWNGEIGECYCSPEVRRPFFFLGSMWRRDLYAVGGNDESFTLPGFDDDFFANCLIYGLQLTPVYRNDVFGLHQDHPRPSLKLAYREMNRVYMRRTQECENSGQWTAIGGPWNIT